MANVICEECSRDSDIVYCDQCYEENYQNGYVKGGEDAIAEASETKQ